MPWTSNQILTKATAPQRSPVVGLGYLPGRQVTVQTIGFTGQVALQTSMDGGESWINCQYLVNNAGNPTDATLVYTGDTGAYSFDLWSNNLLFSIAVLAATAGSVTATYYSGDTDVLPQNPA